MITWIRSANINPGKREAAIDWASRVRDYVNGRFSTNITVHGNASGPTNQIHWVATYDSLEDFEKRAAKIVPDPGYNDLLAENEKANYFNTNSFKDTLFQLLD